MFTGSIRFIGVAFSILQIAIITLQMRLVGVQLKPGVRFFGRPIVTMFPEATIEIQSGVILISLSRHTALGVSRPCILRTLAKSASISIGSGSGLSGVTICSAKSVSIGKDCLIGADVLISDTDFHPLAPEGRRHCTDPAAIASKPVAIHNNVFIGARTIVLKGVTIGENTVIGAGSVVTSSIPSNKVAAGNPAVVLRELA